MGSQATFPKDFETTKRLADAAGLEMSRHAIPPAPANFCVWYNYVGRSIAGLTREIDARIADRKGFAGRANQDLFEKYFGGETEAAVLHEAGSAFKSAMRQMMSRLNKADSETQAFEGELVKASRSLAAFDLSEAPGIQGVVDRLAGATRDMAMLTSDLQEKLATSTEQVAALQNQLDRIRRDALTDGLTGIGNRRCFELALAEHSARAAIGSAELCLALVDIDNFERFTSAFGQKVTDQILKAVGAKLKEIAQRQDTAARCGGQEFGLLMLDTSFETAITRADALRIALAGKHLRSRLTGNLHGQVTVSIGVAQFRATDSIGSFFDRADAALYRAKSEGHNRVAAEAA